MTRAHCKKWVLLLVFLLSPAAWAQHPLEWDEVPSDSLLSRIAEARSGLRVLWWNMGKGETSRKLKEKLGYSPLDRNLRKLPLSKMGPDVLILGEYLPEYLEPETNAWLAQQFPYQKAFIYATKGYGPKRSIGVFSTKPFNSRYKSEGLDWTPPGDDADEAARYRQEYVEQDPSAPEAYVRSYQRIEIQAPSGLISLAPVHLCNPWPAMRRHDGKLEMGLELMLESDNPVANQIQRELGWFRKDLGDDWWRKPLLMMGDF
ncbi:MAG: hypothetical protein EBZ48_16265, partial [Proteobacteria bacterium]|nr:hypothetical protein [Pseudomonadota bacterium]